MTGARPAVRVPLPGADLDGGDALPLPPAAAHYVTVVRRLEPGAPLVVFDGAGREVDATLDRAGDAWIVRPDGPVRAGVAGGGVTLCYAIPKGEKLDAVVRQTTELGVDRIVVVSAERCVVRLPGDRARRRRERWARVAAEAARQCGRADAPAVEGPLDLDAALAATAGHAVRLALHPAGGRPLADVDAAAPAALFVGPEGGFSPTELSRFDAAGVTRVTLGPRVLRTETAAMVGTALVLHRLGVL